MKKTLFFSTLFLSAVTYAGDVSNYIPHQDVGIAYFLPKTQLKVNIVATQTVFTPGEFCQYAGRYLRMDNVEAAPSTHWSIKQITLTPVGIPDSTKAYLVKLKDKSVMSNISLTSKGIVRGINVQIPDESTDTVSIHLQSAISNLNPRQYMTDEILSAGSTAKMAELTAQEILSVRESRNNLLRGNVESMPKDGLSFQLVLDNLNKQEKALTQTFIGRADSTDHLFSFTLTPTSATKEFILFRFSRLLGVLPPDNYAGSPVYIDVQPVGALPPASTDEKKKAPEGIIYNIPVDANISLYTTNETLLNEKVSMGQFGATEVLVDKLFNRKVNTRVIFNPITGGIIKIERDE